MALFSKQKKEVAVAWHEGSIARIGVKHTGNHQMQIYVILLAGQKEPLSALGNSDDLALSSAGDRVKIGVKKCEFWPDLLEISHFENQTLNEIKTQSTAR